MNHSTDTHALPCQGGQVSSFAKLPSEVRVSCQDAEIAVQDVPGAWRIIVVGLFGGFFGSLVDSLLGATLQFSGYSEERDKVVNYPGPGVHKISGTHILTNNQVNVVSASITAVVTALICIVLFA
ncbi:MAG: DUF92 domain-containing protein [Akkermansiaceae bacterium]|nr:DUF92 domain-containing protein [Akkermansiaceae bacterium]